MPAQIESLIVLALVFIAASYLVIKMTKALRQPDQAGCQGCGSSKHNCSAETDSEDLHQVELSASSSSSGGQG